MVVSGDVGETAAGIERALAEVAAAGVPVLAVVGNRECGGDFKKGMARARKSAGTITFETGIRAGVRRNEAADASNDAGTSSTVSNGAADGSTCCAAAV